MSFDPARVDAVTGCKTSLFGLGLLSYDMLKDDSERNTIVEEIR